MLKLVDVYSGELEAEHLDGLTSISFLYDLLIQRDPIANISHKKMPTFDEHRSFVDSRPYKSWDIICADNIMVGAIYLSKQNEIGVSVLKDHQGHGYGPLTICLLMNWHPGETFLANINPLNGRSQAIFEGLGFEMLQVTYVKRPKHDAENESIAGTSMGPARPL